MADNANDRVGPPLFTMGYSGWQPASSRIEAMQHVLTTAGIRTVVDVRLSPCAPALGGSYGPKPWNLQAAAADGAAQGLVAHLAAEGVGYEWIPDLGNPQKNDPAMRVFRQHLDDATGAWPAQRGLDRLAALLQDRALVPACLLCTCADLETCHVGLIVSALIKRLGPDHIRARRLKWNAASIAALARQGLPVDYEPAFLSPQEADDAFNDLLREIQFPAESTVRMAGKEHVIPRQQCAFGDPGTAYRFSGVEVAARPWTEAPALERLRERVAARARPGSPINFVLANLYRDGQDRIGPHADDTRDMLPGADIFSVSLGAERDFVIRPRGAPAVSLVLEHGSLLILRHPTNDRAKHELPARLGIQSPRLNLTFRQMRVTR